MCPTGPRPSASSASPRYRASLSALPAVAASRTCGGATKRGHLPDHVVMELMGITDPKVFDDCYRKRSDDQLREGLSSMNRVNDVRLERVA